VLCMFKKCVLLVHILCNTALYCIADVHDAIGRVDTYYDKDHKKLGIHFYYYYFKLLF
jgi:hypothetical protein